MKTKILLLHSLLLFCGPLQAQRLQAFFSADNVKSCAPAIVNFKDASLGSPTRWQWDFGNGATSTQQHPTTTYLDPGRYTVLLIVSRDTILADTVFTLTDTLRQAAYIHIARSPQVAFRASRLSGCNPVRVQFTDATVSDSLTKPVSWEWDFGDDTKGTGQNPQHVYRQEGTYAVTLKVTDDLGCSAILLKPNYITVTGGVVPLFTHTPPPACGAPATIQFTNKSTGPGTLRYTWLFGDGATSRRTNPTHVYRTNDTFSVALRVASSAGCVDTLFQPNAVLVGAFQSSFSLDGPACPGGPAQLVNNSLPLPSASKWLFDDGTTSTETNPRKVFGAAGPVAVTLVNTFGTCTDTLTKNIAISAPPVVLFATPDTVKCSPGLVARFQNNTQAAAFAWEFGDGGFSTEAAPVHTYNGLGNYNVTLRATSADGCVSTITKEAYIRIAQPVVVLNNEKAGGCIPYEYKPGLSVTTPDGIASVAWDFGDDQSATGLAPVHTYRHHGTYNVSVAITTTSGCIITKQYTEAVKTGTRPRAGFSAQLLQGCASTPIVFTNLSTGTDTYAWDFGDGGTSSVKNPTYTFQDTGWMDVQLAAFNNGCADTVLKKSYIRILPSISKFTFRPDCAKRLEYRFEDQSVDALSWQWDFGDGSTFNGRQPGVHVFPDTGRYEVKLTTTNGSCSHTFISAIKIGTAKPDFKADTTVACKPATINLRPLTADMTNIQSLAWQFSNGSTVIDQVSGTAGTAVNFTKSGFYDVMLVTIDAFGCRRDTVLKEKYLRINGPVANFGSPNAISCTGRTVEFTDSTLTDGLNGIAAWEWSFGTGAPVQTFTAPPFLFKYDTAGLFDVRLKVTDAAGCTDVLFKPQFVQTTTIKAAWDAPAQTCPGAPVPFTNNTQSNLFTSVWRFGNGDTVHGHSPQYAYRDTGNFTVTLLVTNAGSCTDSLQKPAAIYSGRPKADFDAVNFLTYCIPYQAQFFNRSAYYTSSYWNLAQGISRQQDASSFYTQKGTYKISLTVTSPGGCVDTIAKTLTVKDLSEGVLEYDNISACEPLIVGFKAFDSLKGRFVWDFGNGTVKDTTTGTLLYTYRDFGNFIPKVILYEPTGCVMSLTARDTIRALGVDALFGVNQTVFCDGGTLFITDSTTSNDDQITYLWNFGDGSPTSGLPAPSHVYNRRGTYRLSLSAVTSTGCADSASVVISVSETPVMQVVGDTVFCARERKSFNSVLQNPGIGALRWEWTLPDKSTTSVAQPGTLLFRDSGSFFIQAIATTPEGCADTARKHIRVHPLPTIATPPPYNIVAGQSLRFPVMYSSGVRNYLWTPAQTLSCKDCPQPEALTKVNTRYTIIVVDSNGCTASGEVVVNVTCAGATTFAPNTFSPNGDGRNDVFYLRGSGIERVRLLRVINRWGEMVFEKRECSVNEASAGWDGRFRGKAPLPDVYVYQAEVYCFTGEIIKFEGNVALIQ